MAPNIAGMVSDPSNGFMNHPLAVELVVEYFSGTIITSIGT